MDKYKKKRLKKYIIEAIKKFDLNLAGKKVLTEAATENYAVTPVTAALAGAEVYAFAKDSKYGSKEKAASDVMELAEELGVSEKIKIVFNIGEVKLDSIDVLTNTGFLRPISADIVEKLPETCVIPLMWEPWEFREKDIDIEACIKKGIKVYGTNESDPRVETMKYLGYLVLRLLLDSNLTPLSGDVLLIGTERFVVPVSKTLKECGYKTVEIMNKNYEMLKSVNLENFGSIVLLEHEKNVLLVGESGALIHTDSISEDTTLIHICGNVSLENAKFRYIPDEPREFGYMSYTVDYVDPRSLVDLHAAGLKVAEGMLKANELGLSSESYKRFMESNYPAKAFDDPRLW